MSEHQSKQLLHLVFGGELESIGESEIASEIVGEAVMEHLRNLDDNQASSRGHATTGEKCWPLC